MVLLLALRAGMAVRKRKTRRGVAPAPRVREIFWKNYWHLPGVVSKLGFLFVGEENKPAMRECGSR
jgi:hypothetical protein